MKQKIKQQSLMNNLAGTPSKLIAQPSDKKSFHSRVNSRKGSADPMSKRMNNMAGSFQN